MSKLIHGNPWVWVVVQESGGNEQFMGLHDQEENIGFIPVFISKEEALECFQNLPREKGVKYEVQAIQYDELVRQSAQNGFMLFILNNSGEILEKMVISQ